MSGITQQEKRRLWVFLVFLCICEINYGVFALPTGSISVQKCKEIYHPMAPNYKRYNTSTWINKNGDPIVIDDDSNEFKQKHLATLGYEDGTKIAWSCGGTLISNKFILTTAHCINTRQNGKVKHIRLGNVKSGQTADLQDFGVAQIIIHPNYTPQTVYNDIALIELDKEVTYTKFVRPACLNTQFEVNPSATLSRTIGWHITTDEVSEDIMTVIPTKECKKSYGDSFLQSKLGKGIEEATQICAGTTTQTQCQRDPGGPLEMKNYEYFFGYTIVGIPSFGKACDQSETPVVYTRISHYIEWIESIVWPKGL